MVRNVVGLISLYDLIVIVFHAVGLHHVDDEAFHKLSNVVELSMSHNSLTALPTRALEQLTRLRVLDLSHNHIKMIGHEAFRNNPALETITLNK